MTVLCRSRTKTILAPPLYWKKRKNLSFEDRISQLSCLEIITHFHDRARTTQKLFTWTDWTITVEFWGCCLEETFQWFGITPRFNANTILCADLCRIKKKILYEVQNSFWTSYSLYIFHTFHFLSWIIYSHNLAKLCSVFFPVECLR